MSVAQDTHKADEELDKAYAYQQKAARRWFCLLIFLILVVALILVAVSTCHLTACCSNVLTLERRSSPDPFTFVPKIPRVALPNYVAIK